MSVCERERENNRAEKSRLIDGLVGFELLSTLHGHRARVRESRQSRAEGGGRRS